MFSKPGSRLPVTLVAGSNESLGRSRLISRLRAARPSGQRWALLSSNPPLPSAEGGLPAAADEGDLFRMAGGCACCQTGPVFRATLVRVLRAGPWDQLHIEVEAGGHPHRLVDQLRSPPFDLHLDVQRLLLALSVGDVQWHRTHPDSTEAGAGLSFATDFLMPADANEDLSPAIDAWLAGLAPWPRRLASDEGGPLPGAPDALDDLPGWRRYRASESAASLGAGALLRRWPAQAGPSRRRILSALEALAGDPAVTGLQMLARTSREWYRWCFGEGRGSGPLAFDTGSRWVEAETGWRMDNRLCVWLSGGPGGAPLGGPVDRPASGSVEARLQTLAQALQSP